MTLVIRLRRLGYRAAHTVLRAYWFIARPEVEGVKCILMRDGDMLLVRHTYGERAWDLPGGTVKRGEDARQTARREMQEELGVEIDDWRALGVVSSDAHHRRDRMHIFGAELDDHRLTLDLGEIAAVRWFSRAALPADMSEHVRRILARVDGGE